jgi:hypothetical protein
LSRGPSTPTRRTGAQDAAAGAAAGDAAAVDGPLATTTRRAASRDMADATERGNPTGNLRRKTCHAVPGERRCMGGL